MSNDNTEIFVRISSQLGELTASIKSVLSRIEDHEKRLDDLEKGKNASWKDNIIGLLVKGLVASIFVISSLTGASALIKQVLGL